MPASAKSVPGVDAEAPDQGCRQASARAVAPAVPARRREPRRARHAERLRHHRRRYFASSALRVISTLQRPASRRCCSIRTRWRRNIRKARSPGRSRSTPITARTRRRKSTASTYQLEIGGLVDNKKPWTLPELYKLPEVSQITRHVCVEGWSAIGSWQGVRLSDFLKLIGADLTRQICLVPVRRGLFQHHRHADRAASADAADAQIRPPDPAARLRLPDQDPHPDQARLQEPEIRHRHVGQNNDAGGYWENQGYNWFSGL